MYVYIYNIDFIQIHIISLDYIHVSQLPSSGVWPSAAESSLGLWGVSGTQSQTTSRIGRGMARDDPKKGKQG